MTHHVITRLEQVTANWLTSVLRQHGSLPQGHVVSVNPQARLPGGSVIVPLRPHYSADSPASAPARLIIKFPDESALSVGNQREIEFYTRIAPAMPNAPVVLCYDVAYDPDSERFHLLMEDLSETLFSHPPSMLPPTQTQAEQIIDALAYFHAFWWDHPRLGQDIGKLPTATSLEQELHQDEKTFAAWADFLGDRLSDKRRQVYQRVFDSFLPVQIKRLAQRQSLTLIHDDPHVGNFLYPRDPSQDRLRIIDWKSWHIAVGPSDLAHMMAVFWFAEHRARFERQFLASYYNRLIEYGVQEYTWEACWHDYGLAIIGYLTYPAWQWSNQGCSVLAA